jgi:hypothetical protein
MRQSGSIFWGIRCGSHRATRDMWVRMAREALTASAKSSYIRYARIENRLSIRCLVLAHKDVL